MPSYSVRRQRVKEFKMICSGVSDNIAQSVLEMNNWKVNEAINHFFNNRHLYPQLKQGNKKKLEKIFSEYSDPSDPTIMSENGMIKFFKDVGINPESHETLAVSWHLQAAEMGLIQKDEFVSGFSKSGCSGKSDIKKVVSQVVRTLSDQKQFKEFYRWVFHHVKEDDKKKTVPTDLAIQLWQIVLQKHKNQMPLLNKWLEFCDSVKDNTMKVISRDVWEQVFDFLKEVKNLNNYDDNGAWPVAIDEFVEYFNDQNNKNNNNNNTGTGTSVTT